MTDAEFIQTVVGERIAAAAEGKIKPIDTDVSDRAEQMIRGMNEEDRKLIESYIEQLISREADVQVHAYIGGFKDGVLLMKKLDGVGAKDKNGGN